MAKVKEITPSQYFDYLKGAKNVITTDALKNSYEAFLKLAEKYQKLGQVESLKKLCFLADVLVKEEKLIEMGINTYVYKDTIEDYIENVADKTVKIVELSRYMREIPDDLVETIEKTKDIFDELTSAGEEGWSIKVYGLPSKNYEDKIFLTCSLI